MDINVDTNLLNDAAGWHREYNAKRNAAVAALVADGASGKLWERRSDDLSRADTDDEQIKWFFWRHYKPESERCLSDRMHSPDAYLYEGIVDCMDAARQDERRRIAKALSNGLKMLLGDEFFSLLCDIADENNIRD